MRAAGVRNIGGAVELLELADPRLLRADEILLDVRACGVGNWDEFVRTGGWDTGTRPPMALGVVAAVGTSAGGFEPSDQVGTGQTVLVNGAGGVTGGMPVQLAAHLGATVIVTASPENAERLSTMGAAHVLDYRQPDWPGQVRLLTSGGVDAAPLSRCTPRRSPSPN